MSCTKIETLFKISKKVHLCFDHALIDIGSSFHSLPSINIVTNLDISFVCAIIADNKATDEYLSCTVIKKIGRLPRRSPHCQRCTDEIRSSPLLCNILQRSAHDSNDTAFTFISGSRSPKVDFTDISFRGLRRFWVFIVETLRVLP